MVSLHTKGSAAPALRLVSTRPDVVEAANGQLVGKSKGVAAVLVQSEDGTVLDFLHVWVSPPTRIELHGRGADGSNLGALGDSVELLAGESLYVQPHAYVDAQEMLGEADGSWTVDPPLAEVLHTGKPGARRLLAKMPGEATIKVATLGLEATVRLVVHETPVARVKLDPSSLPPPPPPGFGAVPPAGPSPPTVGAPGATAPDATGLLDPWSAKSGHGPKPGDAPPTAGGPKPGGAAGKPPAAKPAHDDDTVDPWTRSKKDPGAGKNGTAHKKDGSSKGKGTKSDGKQKGSKTDAKAKSKAKGSEHKNEEATW
jgi:hypothetical protein